MGSYSEMVCTEAIADCSQTAVSAQNSSDAGVLPTMFVAARIRVG